VTLARGVAKLGNVSDEFRAFLYDIRGFLEVVAAIIIELMA
jgi:hypothetical protein